jgi:hypothetical protein
LVQKPTGCLVSDLRRGDVFGLDKSAGVLVEHRDHQRGQIVRTKAVSARRAAKALDDGHRTGAAVAMTRCLGPFSVEPEQRTRVDLLRP